MAQVRFTPQSKRTIARILARLGAMDTSSPLMGAALFQIGTIIKNAAQANISRAGIVDTGVMRAQMSFRIEKANGVARVVAGPFGSIYARKQEFGGAFTDEMRRAMFAHFRETGRGPRPSKGVIAGNRWRARPFLVPALHACMPQIKLILRSVGAKAGAT